MAAEPLVVQVMRRIIWQACSSIMSQTVGSTQLSIR